MHRGETLGGDYRLEQCLGRGSTANTYLALRQSDHLRVALKVMDLRVAKRWKATDLCRREAEVLRRLNHPSIPHYIELVELDDVRLAPAQTPAPGETLRARVEREDR